MYTCGQCNTKQSRVFTKNAYHHGVVLVKCEGCGCVHCMADNLGWYGSEKWNVEKLKDEGQNVKVTHADPALLNLINQKVEATTNRLLSTQEARRKAEDEEAAKQAQEEEKK